MPHSKNGLAQPELCSDVEQSVVNDQYRVYELLTKAHQLFFLTRLQPEAGMKSLCCASLESLKSRKIRTPRGQFAGPLRPLLTLGLLSWITLRVSCCI